MSEIDGLFAASNGEPVSYKGQTIRLVDKVAVGELGMTVTFESARSRWRQGVHLEVEDGAFVFGAQKREKSIVLWEDTAPKNVSLAVTKHTMCWVKNVWDAGGGGMDSWHNGAAMIVEDWHRGRRYRCNEGNGGDSFDSLIFSIARVLRSI
jgi:hypothetical protein